MKTIEEVKKAKQYLYSKPLGAYDVLAGKLKLSSGIGCGFVAGWNEGGWEHVSVELQARRLPIWEEMCEVKDIFWDDKEGPDTSEKEPLCEFDGSIAFMAAF